MNYFRHVCCIQVEFAVAELDLQEDPTSVGKKGCAWHVCVGGVNRHGVISRDFNDLSFMPSTC